MKKILVIMFAMLMSLNIMSMAAFAAEMPVQSDKQIITPQVEETEWVYRVHDGVLQKRLWSDTYGVWLTDWINCA